MKLGTIIFATLFAMGIFGGNSGQAAPVVKPLKSSPQDIPAEVARLRADVNEQRQLIMQLVRIEQEHYDLLLRLIQGRAGGGAVPAPSSGGITVPGAPAAATTPEATAPSAVARRAPVRTGTLHGKIAFPGGTFKDVYVYVDNVKSPPAHGHRFEIAQRDKQFVPPIAVVQLGTKVVFPNYDSVFHNVFSGTPRHPFDLGSYRAGDAPKSVDMTVPGVVEVFCNMHAKMHASVLVVPSPLFTRVASDGSFQLDGVPLGSRKIVVWGPHNKPSEQTVDLPAAGADVSLTLEAEPEAAHNNKFGQPYGSYKD